MSPHARRSGVAALGAATVAAVALAAVALAAAPGGTVVSATPAQASASAGSGAAPAATAPAASNATVGAIPSAPSGDRKAPEPSPSPSPSTLGSGSGSTRGASAAASATAAAPARQIFAGRTYVALYGKPGTRALGVLGEQGTAATIRRVKRMAASYRRYTSRTVVPALEVIATVASRGAGKDGNYSAESSVASLRPLVRAARKAGVHVVLDLQPGRSSFLTQAKRYRSLLVQPHVSLALDPEWRLRPGQVHLRQVGSVDAKEINRVIRWLADLTADHHLPQKMLLLHQFRRSMITHRSSLDMSHKQLAIAVQMDGQGSQPAKRSTYAAIRRGGPAGLVWGWKNFIDEDHPMLSPRATMRLRPQPRWVSYQ